VAEGHPQRFGNVEGRAVPAGQLPVGLTCWIVSVVSFSVSLAFLLAPLEYGGRFYFDEWTFQDPTGGFLISAFGALLLLLTLHVHNAMGALWRFMARHLLTAPAREEG